MSKFTKICQCCGLPFETNSPQKLFCNRIHYLPCPVCGNPVEKKDRDFSKPPKCCSPKCAHILRQRNMKQRKCQICGEMFKPSSGNALICNKEHHVSCSICGKDMILTREMWQDKIDTCSKECAKEKLRRFYQDKYSTDHPMQNSEVQKHHKQAMFDKYGVEFALQSDELKQHAVETNKEKFGSEWALGNKEFHDKIKATMSEKYGAPTTLQSAILKEKVAQTMLDKYGYDNPMKSEEFLSKARSTNTQRYGTPNAMQNSEIYAKMKGTRIDHNGKYWTVKMSDKAKHTSLKHYGYDNLSKSPEIQAKIKRILTERYGENYGLWLQRNCPPQQYISVINKQFLAKLNEAGITGQFEYNKIPHYRYDIVLDNQKVLIEIDPTYTHSIVANHWCEGLDPLYHKNKSLAAAENGYRCIHVFD